jgi:dTMP kinase
MSDPMSSPTKPPFIVLEGIDGAGTTTQAQRLKSHLESFGRRVHTTREPSDGPIGALVRQILRKEIAGRSASSAEMMALLFAADRIDHGLSEIETARAEGAIVISDRYDLSSLAYQSAAGGVDAPPGLVDWIRSLNQFAIRPDLTIVVDVPGEVARARRLARGGAEELYEAAELQARLAEVYLSAESLVPSDRLVHVDGVGPVEEVGARIVTALRTMLQLP